MSGDWTSSTYSTSRASPATAARARCTSCRAVPSDTPRGSGVAYMPELNELCGLDEYSRASGQPLTKHLIVEVAASDHQP